MTTNNKNIWAPWRMQYMLSLAETETDVINDNQAVNIKSPDMSDNKCFLVDYWEHPENDKTNLILFRNETGFVLLNRYPYSNGHLLIALGESRPRLLDYDPDQLTSLWQLIQQATNLMELTLNPQGINTGINQGRAAGAGIPQHLHVHIIPRWSGDTNFITVVGGIRVVPDSLEAMYQRYLKNLSAIGY